MTHRYIKITDHIKDGYPIYNEEGLMLFEYCRPFLEDGEPFLTIDFKGVSIASLDFLNAFIGKLVWEGVGLELVNGNGVIRSKFDKVVKNAFLTKDKYHSRDKGDRAN